MAREFAFDKRYYDRFYRDPKTRVASSTERRQHADFVCSYLKHMGQTVQSVLDLGCGVGAWKREIKRHYPKATYHGVEVSQHMCDEYGWEQGSVVDYTSEQTFDFVICHGVLQYLDARSARRAIANLQRLGHGAMFLEALTKEDWEYNCDRSVTDRDVYLRPVEWYRTELSRYFTSCGGGVFLTPQSNAALFELEKME